MLHSLWFQDSFDKVWERKIDRKNVSALWIAECGTKDWDDDIEI